MTEDTAIKILNQLSDIRALAVNANAKIEGLNERLFNGGAGVIAGLQDQIHHINDERHDEKKWVRINNTIQYTLTPIVVGLHITLRKLGMNI